MPSLQEMYQEAVKHSGQDSPAARAIRDQLSAEEYRQGMSAQKLYVGGAGARPPRKGAKAAKRP